jgi:hypothetical protein
MEDLGVYRIEDVKNLDPRTRVKVTEIRTTVEMTQCPPMEEEAKGGTMEAWQGRSREEEKGIYGVELKRLSEAVNETLGRSGRCDVVRGP